ncbi:hypothetical protein Hanom_Chr04g00305451 [Helianthus anomalus]
MDRTNALYLPLIDLMKLLIENKPKTNKAEQIIGRSKLQPEQITGSPPYTKTQVAIKTLDTL